MWHYCRWQYCRLPGWVNRAHVRQTFCLYFHHKLKVIIRWLKKGCEFLHVPCSHIVACLVFFTRKFCSVGDQWKIPRKSFRLHHASMLLNIQHVKSFFSCFFSWTLMDLTSSMIKYDTLWVIGRSLMGIIFWYNHTMVISFALNIPKNNKPYGQNTISQRTSSPTRSDAELGSISWKIWVCPTSLRSIQTLVLLLFFQKAIITPLNTFYIAVDR